MHILTDLAALVYKCILAIRFECLMCFLEAPNSKCICLYRYYISLTQQLLSIFVTTHQPRPKIVKKREL